MQSGNMKLLYALLGGAAVGATLAVLFAPDSGGNNRNKIARELGSIKNTIAGKLATLAGAADELSATVKSTAKK